MATDLIIYEQPTNELTRVCLRLEHLFSLLDKHLHTYRPFNSRDTITLMIDILNVLDRPDLKSKFTQEFHRLIKVFSQLQSSPAINKPTLKHTLDELNQMLQYFVVTKGKFAQPLRDSYFVAELRSHLATAGGDCGFELPAFHFWLQQYPLEKQQQIINGWIIVFDEIRAAINLLLRIVRHSSEPTRAQAENGYYYDVLVINQAPSQLIRIGLAKSHPVFPQVSVGKHRMNIRFLQPHRDDRPTQTEKNISFELTICNI